MVELVVVIPTKIRFQLFFGDELVEIWVEADLITSDRIQEGRDALVKEVQKEREVDDQATTQCLDVMMLKNSKNLDLINIRSVLIFIGMLTFLAVDTEGFVRNVVVL